MLARPGWDEITTLNQDDDQPPNKRQSRKRKNISNAIKKDQVNIGNNSGIPTSNRYECLSSDEECENTEASNPPRSKVPPIFVHNITNYKALVKDLDELTTESYTTILKSNQTYKINLGSVDDFRKITSHFDSHNVKYHSFCPPDNKRYSVVIRNVPYNLKDDDIKEELQKTYSVTKVTRLLNKQKHPTPLCAVEIDINGNEKEIFNLRSLFRAVVSVEPRRKSRDIPQCTRCQRFGHTHNFCKLDARCVKCVESHHYKDCKKKSTEDPKCVNCGEKHPANYKGCVHYQNLKYKTKTKMQHPAVLKPNSLNQSTQNSYPRINSTQMPTYANVTKNNLPQSPQSNPITSLIDQIPNLFSQFVNFLIDLIKPHIESLKSMFFQQLTSLITPVN